MVTQIKDVNSLVKKYLDKPYTIVMEYYDDAKKPYYAARVLEFEGCMTTADTPEEAIRDIADAMREWLQINLKLSRTIPGPLKSRKYSGKVIVRMPPSLHNTLVEMAELEGVSFNQYMVTALAKAAGRDEAIKRKKVTAR